MIKSYMLNINKLNNEQTFRVHYEMLSDARQKKIDRYHFKKDKLLSLGAGIVADYGLRTFGLREKTAQMIYNAHGKPYLKEHKTLFFNVSHSGEYAICAFSDHEIGVDIEKVGSDNLELARRFFTDGELAYINRFEGEEKHKAFYRIWCLKESFIKTVGKGLSIPLNAFEIEIDQDVKLNQSFNENHYSLYELELLKGYRIAICAENHEFETFEEITDISDSL